MITAIFCPTASDLEKICVNNNSDNVLWWSTVADEADLIISKYLRFFSMFSAVISSTNSWVILLKSSFPRTWPESLGVTRHDGVDDAELNAKLSNVSSPMIKHTQCMLQLNWIEHLSPIIHVSIVWRSYHLGDSSIIWWWPRAHIPSVYH